VAARRLSEQTLEISRRVRGEEHPYTVWAEPGRDARHLKDVLVLRPDQTIDRAAEAFRAIGSLVS
jgi:hypothetical protein